MGELGLFGLVVPEEYGGSLEDADGGDFTIAVRRDRGARPGRPVDRHHALGRGRARHQPDPHLRHRRAEGAVAARPRRRPRARGFGLTEPDAGSDAGGTKTKAPRSRRRVGGRRGEGVHHQLRHRHHLGRHGDGAPAPTTASPRSRDHDPFGHAGLHRRAPLPQARLAHLRHPRAVLRRLPRARGQPARAAGHGFRQFLTTLDDGRIAISALALGCAAHARGGHRLREARTPSAADRGQPGRRLPASPTSPSWRELAQLLTYKAAWLKDEEAGRRRSPGQAGRPIAKLYTTEAAVTRDPDRHAGVRRQRLHGGVPGGALLPRREDPRDRRGHVRDPADGHRPSTRLGLPS
jgi:short/branched chain acyl-CoA dehydrogenase